MGTSEVRALDGVSLHIDQGEFVAIMGPSGSGKSTMMHLLGCLDRPTGGVYRFLGETVSSLNDRQLARIRNRSIGFVFQTFNLISRMSAWENVALPLFYARRTITKPGALEALERVGLSDRAIHQPNELSGGERQRVAIARAIVNRPRLILADEPTGNLDSKTGEQILGLFHELHRSGSTVVVVTHEPAIAEQAQRIVTMLDGKINADHPSPRAAGKTRRAETADLAGQSVPGAEPAAASPVATDNVAARAEEAPAAAVLHPSAKRALIWTLIGPACVLALLGWVQVLGRLKAVNPGFVKTAGPLLLLVLAAMVFVAPILGFVHGRKGARWVRLAPARFTGLRRALVAQWLAGIHLLLVTTLVGLFILATWIGAQSGFGRH